MPSITNIASDFDILTNILNRFAVSNVNVWYCFERTIFSLDENKLICREMKYSLDSLRCCWTHCAAKNHLLTTESDQLDGILLEMQTDRFPILSHYLDCYSNILLEILITVNRRRPCPGARINLLFSDSLRKTLLALKQIAAFV